MLWLGGLETKAIREGSSDASKRPVEDSHLRGGTLVWRNYEGRLVPT